ncbi:glycoside hydrolase family 18 protein [Hyaloscypha variabilis]
MKLTATFSYITYLLLAISAATGTFASLVKGVDPSLTGFRNVGYFGNWNIYAKNFTVSDIPLDQYTHLLYSFADIDNSTGTVSLSDEWADTDKHFAGDAWDTAHNVHGNIRQLLLAKKKQPTLKTMLSIGGWTYSPSFNEILKSASKRSQFATTAVKLMYNLGFDGLNLDWEHIATAEESTYFVDLLKKIRHLMNDYAVDTKSAPFLLSVAMDSNPKHYTIMDIPAMDKHLNFWDLMAYDYAGSWDETTGHHAALFLDSKNPISTPFNTETAVNYYLNEGKIHPSKINLGFALYGRAFTNTDGPGKPFSGVGGGSLVDASGDGKGVWDIKDLPHPGAIVTELPEIAASYSYDSDSRTLISYDTPNIVRQKAKWLKEKGLGGAMWWQVDGDKTGEESLVGTVVKELGKLEKSKNHINFPSSEYENIKNGMNGEGVESAPRKTEHIDSTESEDYKEEEFKFSDDSGEESKNSADASTHGLLLTEKEKGGKKSAASKMIVPSRAKFGLVVAGSLLVYLL